MQTQSTSPSSRWAESDSQTFVDYGRYFVPAREQQIETLVSLIPAREESFGVLELCCGEGLLAGAILDRFPTCMVIGYDGSLEMLCRARDRLAVHGDRFQGIHGYRREIHALHSV